MSSEKRPYINVDELLPRVSLEQVAAYYGVALPELKRIGNEIRTRCFLACGRTAETGDRALAIQAEDSAKRWHCHQYGCGKGGNLVSLCDLLKPGSSGGGRPRGQRFKELAADLLAIVEGRGSPPLAATAAPAASRPAPTAPPSAAPPNQESAPPCNARLAQSDNERARGLVHLDAKFQTDPAGMSPPAAGYFRRRPFLSPEACRKWRVGYLPRDSGGDRSGGTMRGLVVYPVLSETGDLLTWFGRDPSFEEKRRQWEAGGKTGREPEKFHFVKGFHRGLELFGQQAARLREPGYRETVRRTGIVVVEGPNDVIALDALGVPAVGLLSNTITAAQVRKISTWARQLANERVLLLLDCDPEGENGARQMLWELAPHCDVRLGWSSATHGGRFENRQPESLTAEEWAEIFAGACARTGEPISPVAPRATPHP